MAIYLEKIIEALSNGTRNFTRHTFLISLLTLIALTVLQGWIVALPWETDNGSIIGISVGLSEVGCLIGATILSIFPSHRRNVHCVLFLIGVVGCLLGIFAITQSVHTPLLLISFTLIGKSRIDLLCSLKMILGNKFPIERF
ncbi:uncharacterized protein LOC142337982 [Convolutriloba macropyga]|uniref:uncharacterized protein LOC142337982 n=1 Tax=Convolutriloba macropyga TaxID=536237 RepID=UPI003F528890